MRARFGLAEHWRAAFRAKAPMHDVAAVSDASVVAQLTLDPDLVRRETGIDSTTAPAEVLTHSAPALPRDDRRRADYVTHTLAKT